MTGHEEFESLAALDAIGAATDEEQQQLAEHLQTCEECQRMYAGYAETAAMFGRAVDPAKPPAAARAAVMDAITTGDVTEISAPRRRGDSRWWLATAATLFFALWAWRELGVRVAREHIASRDAEVSSLTEQNALLAQRNEKLNTEIAALAGAGTRVISLAGQQASARVFLDPAKRRAFVLFANLPANAADKSYQLWIIRGDQPAPQGVGVFDASPNGTAAITVENLPVDTEIKAMAVTVEPRGGVQTPTNSNYVVNGKT